MELPQIQSFTMAISAIFSIYLILFFAYLDTTKLFNIINFVEPKPTTLAPTTLPPIKAGRPPLSRKVVPAKNLKIKPKPNTKTKLQEAKKNKGKKAEPVKTHKK